MDNQLKIYSWYLWHGAVIILAYDLEEAKAIAKDGLREEIFEELLSTEYVEDKAKPDIVFNGFMD